MTAASVITSKAPPDEWHLQSSDGQRYGPISKSELDAWLAEDRIAADSQLLPPGGQSWVEATQIYPSLARMVQQTVQQSVAQAQAPQFPAAMPTYSNPAAGTPSFPPPSPTLTANPYASPQTSASPMLDAGDEGGSLAIVRRLLIETRPWAMFIAIVGFVYGAFVILAGGLYLVIGIMAMFARGGALGGVIVAMIGLGMLAFGSLIIYAFVHLTSYATRIGEFQRSTNVRILEGAMRAQRSFWRMAGAIVAILLALALLGFVLFLAFYATIMSQIPSSRF